MIAKILLTPGEPAGVGPDLTLKLAQQNWPAQLIAISDPDLLNERAKQLNIPVEIIEYQAEQDAPHQAGRLFVLPVKLNKACVAGKLDPANAEFVLQCLQKATELLMSQQAHAVATGPVHKGIINDANIAFTGHTEFFAQQSNTDQVVMMLATPGLRVALVTTHLPLAEVPNAITQQKVKDVLQIVHAEMQNKFGIHNPKIAVCGLNPHAGENGHLGMQEINIIEPVINLLQQKNMQVSGPWPADTVFTKKYIETSDVIVAMYHDQGLPVLKYKGFGHAVNITLGLPFIRTSVDHGTALDLAGSNKASIGSFEYALQCAIDMAQAKFKTSI